MSYIFLLEQGGESSADSFSAIPASALSSGMPTRGAFFCLDNATGCYRGSPSGMMSRRSTASRGAGAWMSLRAAFRVRTYPQRAKALESTEIGRECGGTWPASLARYDRDSRSWKTAQCSLLGDSESFSATWPRWGTMRSGVCGELPTLGRRTEDNESGSLLPTPRAADHKGARTPTDCTARRVESGEANLSEWVQESRRMWPTPVADGDRRTNYAQGGTSLGYAVRMWPTPCASEARQGFQNRQNGKKGSQESLSTVVQGAPASVAGGALNPTWVEWLMGWPLGWTDCAASATDKYRQWRRSHGRR